MMKQNLDDGRAAIAQRLFDVSSLAELKQFDAALDVDEPFGAGVSFLVKSWVQRLNECHSETFDPREHLSEDLSAAVLGTWPIVFMGTNAWATKPYLDGEAHSQRTELYFNQIKKIRGMFPQAKIVFSLIPEKDYVLDRYFLQTDRFFEIDASTLKLKRKCAELGISLVFGEYLDQLRKFESGSDFEYPDTHLPASHYIQIFAHTLKGMGLDWQEISSCFHFVLREVYGDLMMKFGRSDARPRLARIPSAKNEQLEVMAGTTTFAEPLGETWQDIRNYAPLRPGKVLILGDSHSSILSNNQLTYLFASTFESCRFLWNPVGIRGDLEAMDVDYVVLEISQRFLF